MKGTLPIPRAPWQSCESRGWTQLQTKRRYSIELGKMLQNGPSQHDDTEVPYLKAQHVQWDRVRVSEASRMWASPTEIETLRVRKGDLLVCEGGEVGRAAVVQEEPPEDCIIQNALHLVRSRKGGEVRFLAYLLRHAATSGWFDVLCNRATIAHFTGDKFGEMWIWTPDLPEQVAIADFLDRETARLDSLVAEKERLLELLAEKRRALITHAVTHGLFGVHALACELGLPSSGVRFGAPTLAHESTAEHPKGWTPNFRDSSLPWLGQIPAHWRTERSKWLFKERDERSENDEGEMLTVSHLTGVTPRSEKEVNMFEAETTEGYKICRKGDLAINTLWAWMGAMGISPCDGIVSPAYNVYVPGPELLGAYVDALVRIPRFPQEVIRYSKGVWSSRLRLYPEGFFQVWLPVPPLDEQHAIVAHIAAETAKLDALRASAERTMALLKERRAALIAAAVTGKITVQPTGDSGKRNAEYEN